MLDAKFVAANPELVVEKLKKRNIKGNFSQIEKFPFYKNLFHYCYFYKLNI